MNSETRTIGTMTYEELVNSVREEQEVSKTGFTGLEFAAEFDPPLTRSTAYKTLKDKESQGLVRQVFVMRNGKKVSGWEMVPTGKVKRGKK